MCCLVAHSESWFPFFCHTYSRVLQKCFESDLSPMSAMPPGPVFQSLPLYSSSSCVLYISDILWTKLKAVDCLRGFLMLFSNHAYAVVLNLFDFSMVELPQKRNLFMNGGLLIAWVCQGPFAFRKGSSFTWNDHGEAELITATAFLRIVQVALHLLS